MLVARMLSDEKMSDIFINGRLALGFGDASLM